MGAATPEDGQDGEDLKRERRTLPAITDLGCWTLACAGAVVALIAISVLVLAF